MKKRNYSKYTSYLLAAFLTAFFFTAGMAQKIEKKIYTADLDSLWSTHAAIHSLSPDGRWVVIGEQYEGKHLYFFILNTNRKVRLTAGNVEKIEFSSDSKWCAFQTASGDLTLIDLQTSERKTYEGISKFNFSGNGAYCAVLQDETLIIQSLHDNRSTEIIETVDFKWNPARNILAISKQGNETYKVITYDIARREERQITADKKSKYTDFMWNGQGNTLVFLEETNTGINIHYYDQNGMHRLMDDSLVRSTFPGTSISKKDLSISFQGDNVFFYRKVSAMEYGKNGDMEVWDTKKPWIYPKLKDYYERERSFLLTLWNTGRDSLLQIGDDETPNVQFNPSHSHAVVFDRLIHEPAYKQYENVDLYLKDFETGKKTLIVENQYNYPGFVTLSPSGRYVAYFKSKDWWVYDSRTKQTVNLTKDFDFPLEDIYDWPQDDREPYGNPGWSDDEKYIIVHDRYDVWLLSPDGKYKKRISEGKENKIRYKVSRDPRMNDAEYLQLLHNYSGISFDLDKGLILEMQGEDLNTGYAIWKKNQTQTIIYEPRKIENALTSRDNSKIVFRKLKFNEPPGIYVSEVGGKSLPLYHSNEKLTEYDLGKYEMLEYKVGDTTLIAALVYPAQYDPDKKYPMITWIYEKKYTDINKFAPPSYSSFDGFNLLKYVTNDYFVLMPGISYTLQHPGESARISVEAAVNQALENTSIDKQKIGLIGHSFGGYETAYIMTQTNLFATGIAGAIVADLPTYYHDVWWNALNSEHMWRTENHIFRMVGSFYEMKEQYYENSPLFHVEKLNKPLLLWAGKNDYNTNWYQSVYMFMAMKRLNKDGRLLLFENEGHTIVGKDNQRKLGREIFEWFNLYLKS